MRAAGGDSATPGRTRVVVVPGLLAMSLDVVVAFAAVENWRSFAAAPNNDSLVPADDPDYFIAAFLYVGASLIRYVALLGFVVAVLRYRGRALLPPGRDRPRVLRRKFAIASVVIAVELGYVAVAWRATDPTAALCVAQVGTVVLSAVVTAMAIVSVRRWDVPRNASDGGGRV